MPTNTAQNLRPPPNSRDALDVARGKIVMIRLTDEERQAWQAAAEADKRKLADWVRVTVNAHLSAEKPRAKKGGK